MRKSIFAVAAVVALAAPLSTLAAEPAAGTDPMQGWRPPKVKNEKQDRAEITKLFKTMEAAGKKGDIEAAAALVDFPVLMLTDDSKGEAHGGAWSREQWVKMMEPFYKPMPDMKVKEKPTVFLISDSLATVTNIATITMGKKPPMTTRNAMLLARVGGEWKVKAMVEGGWGDSMAGPPEGAAKTGQAAPPAGASETSPSSATGETAPRPSGTAGETAPPSSTGQTTPPAAEPPQSTTK